MRSAAIALVCALAAAASAEDHALLVGCTEYYNLKDRPRYESRIRLIGPGNDVALLERTFKERLGVRDVTTLTKEKATRANILQALDRLAAAAKKGDRIIFYFAGHGSQQPDTSNDEADGYDEIFLPADVKGWSGKKGRVENAITDDELGERLRAARDRGVAVWVLLDCCHAGGGVRGGAEGDEERLRRLDPAVLGVPPGARGLHGRVEPVSLESLEGIVAMYAAPGYRPAPELKLPRGHADRQWHGAFSFVVAGQLQRTGGALTFRELHARVLAAYREVYSGTAPQAEGDLGAFVVGSGAASPLLLTKVKGKGKEKEREKEKENENEKENEKEKEYRLNAGRLAGIDEGTVLAAVRDGKRVGYAIVKSAGLAEARCEPLLRDGLTLEEEVVPAEVIRTRVRDLRLRVRFEGVAEEPLGFVEAVERRADADWVVRPGEEGAAVLQPAHGEGPRLVAPPRNLARRLHAVFRARNLARLADLMSPLPAGLTLEMRVDGRVLRPGQAITPGDEVTVSLKNETKRHFDVTVLGLDSQCGIAELFPGETGRCRIEAGARAVELGPYVVHDQTVGLEHLLVIAVPRGERDDLAWFGWLAQDSLPRERSSPDELNALLRALAFGEGARRGHDARPADACAALFSWRTGWGSIAAPATFPGEPDEVRMRGLAEEGQAGGVPDGLRIGPRVYRSGDVVLGGDERPRQMLIDLDGDGDFEVGFHFLDDRRIAFYDTDNSGGFDLVLVDLDGDPEAEVVHRKRNGKWETKTAAREPWLCSHHLTFENGPELALPHFRRLAERRP